MGQHGKHMDIGQGQLPHPFQADKVAFAVKMIQRQSEFGYRQDTPAQLHRSDHEIIAADKVAKAKKDQSHGRDHRRFILVDTHAPVYGNYPLGYFPFEKMRPHHGFLCMLALGIQLYCFLSQFRCFPVNTLVGMTSEKQEYRCMSATIAQIKALSGSCRWTSARASSVRACFSKLYSVAKS
jgi:hypothetical protein